MLTPGKVPFEPDDDTDTPGCSTDATADIPSGYCKLHGFQAQNEGHKCGYCGMKAYFYCSTCFPDDQPTHAICNPTTNRDCFAKHMHGVKPTHCMRHAKRKEPEGGRERPPPRSPQQAAGRQQARSGGGARRAI